MPPTRQWARGRTSRDKVWANATGSYVAATDDTNSMDTFSFRDTLTRDYAEYGRSFIRIGTPDVRAVVERAIDDQLLWPEPIVLLNPFRPGADTWDLHATACSRMLSPPVHIPARAPTGMVPLHDYTPATNVSRITRHAAYPQIDPP